ncbi:mitochondrial cardiolipin hydrolase-like protein [Dinothrombium tinctorium]|uniref:Mitochondrial cardiolipin hydrolase n=1 Tax=Dinothrombium tinctorium TaxID=1965070 RepID=A0A3S3QDG4_9ACAR|nr:mitochondrial cardiolipin hydrolase-like protein [Dinothrombium tinctorium]
MKAAKFFAFAIEVVKGLIFAELFYLIRRHFEKSVEERNTAECDIERTTELNQQTATGDNNEEINKALFFPDLSFEVNDKLFSYRSPIVHLHRLNDKHSPDASSMRSPFRELVDVLESTKKSLDVCIYVFTSPQLANILMDAFDRKVVVRIIVDSREHEAFNSQISKLREKGISIRSNTYSLNCLMHNKFIIIDRKILITGSFNWTKGAILQNYDNLLITTQRQLIEQYQAEYDKLWDEFAPAEKNM